jgi:hypothetical protein
MGKVLQFAISTARWQSGQSFIFSLTFLFLCAAGFKICSEIDWYSFGCFKVAVLGWYGITSDVDLHIKFGKHMKSPLKHGKSMTISINHTIQKVTIATKDATQTISLPGPRYMDKYPPDFEKSSNIKTIVLKYVLR